MNEYEKQAVDFLTTFGIDMKIKFMGLRSFGSLEHDDTLTNSYMVTLKKFDGRKPLSYLWHDSIHSTETGSKPNAYDILSTSGLTDYEMSFEDFVTEFGYIERSELETFKWDYPEKYKAIKALHKKWLDLVKRSRAFFTDEELEALSEIR